MQTTLVNGKQPSRILQPKFHSRLILNLKKRTTKATIGSVTLRESLSNYVNYRKISKRKKNCSFKNIVTV